jgi:hypothetical protein
LTIPQRRMTQRLWNGFIALIMMTVLLIPAYGNTARAGKEGVYINGESYYTLENVRLSPGNDKSTFRFTLELVNNSGSTIDINQYGAAIWDASGNRYASELVEKTSSRVQAGTPKQLKYVSKIPSGISLEELQVEIFNWDFSVPGYMNPVGKLSVAAASDAQQSDKPQAVVKMSELDSSYASDYYVSFELQRSYHTLVNGSWYLYADLTAENMGSASFKLPSALSVNLKNGSGLSFAGSVLYGGDQSLLPHQKSNLVLQFPVGELNILDHLSIEFMKKASASTSSASGSNANSASSSSAASSGSSTASAAVILESMTITGTAAGLQKGDIQMNTAGRNGLTATVESVSLDAKSDGVYAESVYTLKNEGKKAVTVPAFSAYYQVGGSTLSVAAADNESHPGFLSPGESTSYYYNAVLPNGLDGNSIQLVLQEKKSETVSIPAFVASLPSVSETSGTPVQDGGSVYATALGKLGIKLKSTYRLLSDGGYDVLMSEVEVENRESEAVKLPSLYAGYTDGVNNLEGKTTYVQSSAYINAGQKAVLYVFANVPYDMEIQEGKVYFGQGVLNQNTWTQKKEWARLDFEVQNSGMPEVGLKESWFISDPSRQSTAYITEHKLYNNPDENVDGIMAAVRIEQKNQMTRNGSVVPYTGYIQTSNGEVYPLSSTGAAGKLNKDAKALTTLWAKLPSGVLDDKAVIVFGQQIEGTTFANPKKTGFSVTPNQPSKSDDLTWRINESLYPYTVKFSGVKRIYASGKYTFEFDYMLEKSAVLAGSNTNRILHFELEDSVGEVIKKWDVPLEGNGSMENGTQTLTVASSEIKYADDFLNGTRIKVYEKFENHHRLLGSMNYMLGDN